jgi:hypothetical protein
MCLPKPPELLALYDDAVPMFAAIRTAFRVPDRYTLDVSTVDRARTDDEAVSANAALALYYIQSLRVLAKPDVRVRITSIVNTTACLHQVLQVLAGQCAGESEPEVRQARVRVGAAGKAVTLAQMGDREGAKFMR